MKTNDYNNTLIDTDGHTANCLFSLCLEIILYSYSQAQSSVKRKLKSSQNIPVFLKLVESENVDLAI